jgi:hypothetical protein
MPSSSVNKQTVIPSLFLVVKFITIAISAVLAIIDSYFTAIMTTRCLIEYHFPVCPIILIMILAFISFIMFVWCFIVLIFQDPGSVVKDLERRGVLKQIRENNIPANLRHLQICEKCKIPRPPLSNHCNRCGLCFLHHEFHSDLFGRCIADKTFKASVLICFWGALFGLCLFSLNAALVFYEACRWPFLLMSYAVWLTTLLFANVVVTLMEKRIDPSFYDRKYRKNGRKIGIRKIFEAFGERWWQKMIPRQIDCTSLAWPGVNWDFCATDKDENEDEDHETETETETETAEIVKRKAKISIRKKDW